MKIGLQVPNFTWPDQPRSIAPTLAKIATTADQGGFSSLWVMDHFFQIGYVGKPDEPMLEGYTALGYMAALTTNVMLGTLVTGVIYRQPGVLIKTVTTLDVLSGGRAYLGIGAAWNEDESRGLGIPFPPLKQRFEQLEDALQLAHQMFRDDEGAFSGSHVQAERPINHPLPLHKPHPPIMIGGGGEQKTLRLVAQYADACNLFGRMGGAEIRRKLAVLREHCQQVGRNYEEIERTAISSVHLAPGQMSVQQVIEHCHELAEAGIQHVIFNMPDAHEIIPLETLSRDVIPAVAGL